MIGDYQGYILERIHYKKLQKEEKSNPIAWKIVHPLA
jgi:hypothetical protein